MSKMKELDLHAEAIANHVKEILEDSVDWQLSDMVMTIKR